MQCLCLGLGFHKVPAMSKLELHVEAGVIQLQRKVLLLSGVIEHTRSTESANLHTETAFVRAL